MLYLVMQRRFILINTDYIFLDIPVMDFVEDLVSRYGDPDDYTFTNKRGMRDEFDRQFGGDNSKYKNLEIKDFLKFKSISNPNLEVRRGGEKEQRLLNQDDNYDDNKIGCCIEQTSANALNEFLVELMIGIKKTTNTAKENVMGTYKTSQMFIDEEGDMVSEAELETTTEYLSINNSTKYEAMSNIIYLTRQLIWYSYTTGWFLPSFVKIKLKLLQKSHWHPNNLSYGFKSEVVPAANGVLAEYNPVTNSIFTYREVTDDLNRKVEFTNLKFALIDDNYGAMDKVKHDAVPVDYYTLRNIFNVLIEQLVNTNLMYSFLATPYEFFTVANMNYYKQKFLLKSNIVCLTNGVYKDVISIFEEALSDTDEDREIRTILQKNSVRQSLKSGAHSRVVYVKNKLGEARSYALKDKDKNDRLESFISKYLSLTKPYINSDFTGCHWNIGIYCEADNTPYLFDLTTALGVPGGKTLGKRYGVFTDFGYCILLYTDYNIMGYFNGVDFVTSASFNDNNIFVEYI